MKMIEKLKLNKKEIQILSVVVAAWGIFFIGSGIIMNFSDKTVVKTKYTLAISEQQVAQAQAKTNEIKLKEVTIEVNTPLSVDVKDYLEDVDNLTPETIKALKLDTSLVNINEAGKYQYIIKYKKKKYIGTLTVKEKELPNIKFTLKNLTLKIGESPSANPRTYINENITDEVYNNLTLDISQVNNQTEGNYKYSITYKGTTYYGDIKIVAPGPTIKLPNNNQNTDTDKTDEPTE